MEANQVKINSFKTNLITLFLNNINNFPHITTTTTIKYLFKYNNKNNNNKKYKEKHFYQIRLFQANLLKVKNKVNKLKFNKLTIWNKYLFNMINSNQRRGLNKNKFSFKG